jgi:hypothetical protein
MMGMEILNPSTVVVMSILDTSISMRGRNLSKGGKKEESGEQLRGSEAECIRTKEAAAGSGFQYMNARNEEIPKCR